MKPVAGDWLSDLKLRGTWGQIGNQGIDPYKFVPTMSPSGKEGCGMAGEWSEAADFECSGTGQ